MTANFEGSIDAGLTWYPITLVTLSNPGGVRTSDGDGERALLSGIRPADERIPGAYHGRNANRQHDRPRARVDRVMQWRTDMTQEEMWTNNGPPIYIDSTKIRVVDAESPDAAFLLVAAGQPDPHVGRETIRRDRKAAGGRATRRRPSRRRPSRRRPSSRRPSRARANPRRPRSCARRRTINPARGSAWPAMPASPTCDRTCHKYPILGQQAITLQARPAAARTRLLYEGAATAAIAYNASATAVQTALRATVAIGDSGVNVRGRPGAYTAAFQGTLATDAGPISLGTNSLSGGTLPSVTLPVRPMRCYRIVWIAQLARSAMPCGAC
jgi:hypothetical protein